MAGTKGKSRKEELMETTINIVSDTGLYGFSMKKVTDVVGCSEALLYRHFSTKDNLLYCCFKNVHQDIENMLESDECKKCLELENFAEAAKATWMLYFRFLIDGGKSTRFYFMYRDSSYFAELWKKDEAVREHYLGVFTKLLNTICAKFEIPVETDPRVLWTFILDVTVMFAMRVMRGLLPDTQKTADEIWGMIYPGVKAYLGRD